MSRRRSIETIMNDEYVTIGELVRLTAVRYSTLKYYTEEGMIPFVQADDNLTRRYARADAVERIAYINKLKADKLSIAEIKQLLNNEKK